MESRFSNVFFCMLRFVIFLKDPWMSRNCEFWPKTPRRRFAVSADVSRICDVPYEEARSWPEVNSAMFGAEPYQFEPTYPPGEEPALHGDQEEERSASPEPIRVGNTDWCVCGKCISMSEDECYCCQELDALNEKFDTSGLYSNCYLLKSWTI